MSPSYQNGTCKKVLDIFTVVFLLGTVIVGIWGLSIANDALNTYKTLNNCSMKLNEITIEGNLLSYDREISRQLREKPYLQSLYTVLPNNLEIKEKANLLVNCVLDNEKEVVDWIDIPDLYNKIWGYKSYNDFHNENKYRLREAYIYFEDLLNLIMNVYWYHTDYFKIISPESWSTYEAYLNEIGTHPIFLCVVYGGCKFGYIDKEFAEKLRKIIIKIHGYDVLKNIYNDMLKPEWYELSKKDK